MHPVTYQWRLRRQPVGMSSFHSTQLVCPTCWHVFTTGHYRDHLRGRFHGERRGFWKES
jgi:hypothetical protein